MGAGAVAGAGGATYYSETTVENTEIYDAETYHNDDNEYWEGDGQEGYDEYEWEYENGEYGEYEYYEGEYHEDDEHTGDQADAMSAEYGTSFPEQHQQPSAGPEKSVIPQIPSSEGNTTKEAQGEPRNDGNGTAGDKEDGCCGCGGCDSCGGCCECGGCDCCGCCTVM